jgi:hypothetical protein
VGEIFSFGNSGDRTYIGEPVEGINEPVTVGLRVPPDAEELTFENGALGGRFQQIGDMVYDTTPVLPGQGSRQIIMRYFIPHNSQSLDFAQSFLYPVDQMTLLIAELPQLQVAVPGFALASRETLQGQTYQLWQPEDMAPAQVTVNLTGLLQPGDIDPRVGQTNAVQAGTATSAAVVPLLAPWAPWVVGIVVVLVFAGVVVWSLQQRRMGASDRLHDLHAQRDELLKRIAHLDDRHAIQELDNALWQRERARLKAQLLYVTKLVDQQRSPDRTLS